MRYFINPLNVERICMKLVLLKTVIVLSFLIGFFTNSILGQCSNSSTNYQPKVFEAISNKETKDEIIKRYKQFIGYYCNHDFINLYQMLSSNYLKSTRKVSGEEFSEQEWIKFQLEFYADEKTRLISFAPKEVLEWKDADEKIVYWQINGCLTEIINGKERKVKAATNVSKQNDGIYFSAISPFRISLDGRTQKCSFK